MLTVLVWVYACAAARVAVSALRLIGSLHRCAELGLLSHHRARWAYFGIGLLTGAAWNLMLSVLWSIPEEGWP